MKRLFPYPHFAVAIFIMWISLAQLTFGDVVVGLLIALLTNHIMVFLTPEKVQIKNWLSVLKLIYFIAIDVTVSNLKVAKIICTGAKGVYTGFIVIPLTIEGRTTVAILACIMTMTPGTAWIAYNSKNNELLLHVLNLLEEDRVRYQVKYRYEKLLLEIFQ